MRVAAFLMLAFPVAALAQPATPTNATERSGDKQDKVICKSFAEVGSLIATHKECKTKREWDAEREATQRRLGDCVNMGAATGSHC